MAVESSVLLLFLEEVLKWLSKERLIWTDMTFYKEMYAAH